MVQTESTRQKERGTRAKIPGESQKTRGLKSHEAKMAGLYSEEKLGERLEGSGYGWGSQPACLHNRYWSC